MATTYRAAFGNPPNARKPIVHSCSALPDTSSDAAIAQILEEDYCGMPLVTSTPLSPSGVKLHEVPWESGMKSEGRHPADGVLSLQHKTQSSGGEVSLMSDAEFARQLQLSPDAAATDFRPSMLYPKLLNHQSSREDMLSRSLSRAKSIRVRPRVTASLLPPESEVSADRQRLMAILAQYQLVEKLVMGDGNCQFRALSDQLYGTQDYHDAVRVAVVARLRKWKSSYSCYVPQEYSDYCLSMSNSGTWGDHITLQAAADHYGCRIMVLTSFQESPVISIEPSTVSSPQSLYLSFWAEIHYNSLYPEQEPPSGPMTGASEAHVRNTGNGDRSIGIGSKPPKFFGSRILGQVVKEVTTSLPSLGGR